ncbi:HAMP domain-containing histidine kinase [candidate division WWE3 bacterium]|uniref:histidine kinase n=1 Tax=candidate division WWE3 bacterium TaxID=2053526 RepID=A0A955RWS7_UNCKA|nr:HAMP domain-containing histidine kinase [candidate division WWE3 bacterium]
MNESALNQFYQRFITNDLDPRTDQITLQRVRTFNVVSLILVVLSYFWATIDILYFKNYNNATVEVIGATLGLVFLILYRRSKNLPLMLNIGFSMTTVVIFSLMLIAGFDTVESSWTYLLTPFAFFLTGLQGGIIWTLVIFLSMALIAIANHLGVYDAPIRDTFALNFFMSHSIVAFFSYQYEKARLQAVYGLSLKNQELQRLIYTVSHDLKTPIVSLIGYLSFVKEEIASGEDEQRDSDLNKMGQICNNMRQMINDLLNLSRIRRQGQFSHVSTSDIVMKLLTENESQLRAAGIETKLTGTFPIIFSEERKIEEVFRNLISNAIKYIGNEAKPVIEIGVNDIGQYYEFFVRDNGIGIDEDERASIFNPFYAKSDATKGSGIGLSIAKGFTEDLGGTIMVDSVKGQGSVFKFTIPKKSPVAEEPDQDNEPLPKRNPNA